MGVQVATVNRNTQTRSGRILMEHIGLGWHALTELDEYNTDHNWIKCLPFMANANRWVNLFSLIRSPSARIQNLPKSRIGLHRLSWGLTLWQVDWANRQPFLAILNVSASWTCFLIFPSSWSTKQKQQTRLNNVSKLAKITFLQFFLSEAWTGSRWWLEFLQTERPLDLFKFLKLSSRR